MNFWDQTVPKSPNGIVIHIYIYVTISWFQPNECCRQIYIYIYIFYVYLYANIYQKKNFFMLKNLIKPKPSKGTIFVSIILKKQFFFFL